MQSSWILQHRGVANAVDRKWLYQFGAILAPLVNGTPVACLPNSSVKDKVSGVSPGSSFQSCRLLSIPATERNRSTCKESFLFYDLQRRFNSTWSVLSNLVSQNQTTIRKMATTSNNNKILTIDNLNPNIKAMEYAVRGPLVIRASEIERELANGAKKPFTEVIKANIGDAHAMGQQPITFIRQVVALVSYPELLNSPDFPSDAKSRAKDILDASRGSVGCYSDSTGLELVRRHVAQYIERRDGFPAKFEDIALCGGASEGIRSCLKLLSTVEGTRTGVMIPTPQYPLYSASIVEFNMEQVGYYLDEDNSWGLDIKELERSIQEARKKCNVRAIVVINPGNPTGQVLTRENIEEIIKFAYKEKLFIFADEVYQDNVYAPDRQFHSFKKVTQEMGAPYNQMELVSFMSCSKGYMGECGLRGGYGEIINMDPAVKAMYLKSISATLCSTVLGQTVMDVVVNPPQPGEPSYDQFVKEKAAVLKSLADRASSIANAFNSIPNMKCNYVQGAMYAFPQVILPEKAIAKAKSLGQAPDVFYAFQLLENTGICCVPGSGFGQRPGTYHFRTTILPQPEKLKVMLDKFRAFQENFIKEYQ